MGSDFPHDDSDLQIVMNLQRIRKCMAEGRTVVLLNSREGFYETLYDLLNQNYTEYGGQLFARLAFGTSCVGFCVLRRFASCGVLRLAAFCTRALRVLFALHLAVVLCAVCDFFSLAAKLLAQVRHVSADGTVSRGGHR